MKICPPDLLTSLLISLLASACCLALAGCLSDKLGCLVDGDCNPGRICVAGMCEDTNAGCPPVKDNTLYVDGDAPTGHSGSTPGCSIRTLAEALTMVNPASPWTIIVRGVGNSGPVAVPRRVVPANVTVTGGTQGTGKGAASSFAACSDSVACPILSWPVLDVPSVNDPGIEFSSSGPGALRYFSIIGPLLTGSPQMPSSTEAGIYVANSGGAPVTLDHLRIRQFRNGIGVDPGGNVEIGEDVQSSSNLYGLYAQANSTVAINVSAGQSETEFNHNFSDGIHVESGATSFTMQGPPAPSPAALTPGIGVSFNSGSGVSYAAAAPGALFDGVNFQRNLGSGIDLLAGSVLRVRNCHIFDNQLDGVRIAAAGSPLSVAGIDLGEAADAGGNVIYGNGAANICVEKPVADTQSPGALQALGNDFTDYDQPSPSPKSCASANTLSDGALCRGSVDISDDLTMVVDVGACKID